MKIGVAQDGDARTLILGHNGDWLNLGAVVTDFYGPPSPKDVLDLINTDRLNTSFLLSFIEKARESGRLNEFTIPEPRRFGLPYRPGKIVAVGRNYAEHARELGNPVPKQPLLFPKSPDTCIADGEAIVIQSDFTRVDHEAELAVVIGKRANKVSRVDARNYVAGYTLLNDVTERDLQTRLREKGEAWHPAKNFDTFCPLGPVVALPDDFDWPLDVEIELSVNGETRQKDSTASFIFSIPKLIEYITTQTTLEPGDLIATGTSEGVGPIQPGDRIEIRCPQIGTLSNPVIAAGNEIQ